MNTFRVKGNIGSVEPIRYTQGGKPLLSFSVADNYGHGEEQKTQWIKCIIFGDAVHEFEQRLSKGLGVDATGRLEIHQYERRDGSRGVSFSLWTDKVLLGNEVDWGTQSRATSFADKSNPERVESDGVQL